MVEVAKGRWGPGSDEGQLYSGLIYADTRADRRIGLVGQVSPYTEQRMRAQHGRYLSGLGGESPSGEVGYDPTYQGQQTYDMEHQDDVFGSGIFDPAGRSGTSNPNMGVFASHYSLPGYVARDVPFTVSRDVTDITDGAQVVSVPAGGMSYIETRGKLTRPAVLGPTWRPPQIQPAGVTERDQPYAFLTRPGQPPAPPLNPGAPVSPPPDYRPARDPTSWVKEVGMRPGSCTVPLEPRQTRLRQRSMVNPMDPSIAIGPSNAACSGFGQEEKKPASNAQIAVAGAIVGGAAWLLWSVVRKGGK